jgi:hypothetical protein
MKGILLDSSTHHSSTKKAPKQPSRKKHKKKRTQGGDFVHQQSNDESPMFSQNNEEIPPAMVQTTPTTASSVSILEYSMPLTYVGKKVTFQVTVKDHLFPLVKFLPNGDNDSNLDYSLDTTTICGFLRQHCGVPEQDCPNWWQQQKKNLRKTLTDFRNNRIKEMQKRFLGKSIILNIYCIL